MKNSLWIIFIVILSYSCEKSDENKLFDKLDSPYNIHHMEKTNYCYLGHPIYKYNFTDNNSYFYTDKDQVFSLDIDSSCFLKHKKIDYVIIDNLEKIKSIDIFNNNKCEIYIDLEIDFSRKKFISSFGKETILLNSYYSNHLRDVIYLYEKKINNYNYNGFIFSKQYGLIGWFDKSSIENGYYWTFYISKFLNRELAQNVLFCQNKFEIISVENNKMPNNKKKLF